MRIFLLIFLAVFSGACCANDPWENSLDAHQFYERLTGETVAATSLVTESTELKPLHEVYGDDVTFPAHQITLRNFNNVTFHFIHDATMAPGYIGINDIAAPLFMDGNGATRRVSLADGQALSELLIDAEVFTGNTYDILNGTTGGTEVIEFDVVLEVRLNLNGPFKIRYENCTSVTAMDFDWPVDTHADFHDCDLNTGLQIISLHANSLPPVQNGANTSPVA